MTDRAEHPGRERRLGDGKEPGGGTIIETGVIAKIVGLAARDVPGIHALGTGAARASGALREALTTADLTQGVSISLTDERVTIDITLVAEYPYELQPVGGDVRSAVTLAVESLVGLSVAAVTVTVNDVHVSASATTPTGESVDVWVDNAQL